MHHPAHTPLWQSTALWLALCLCPLASQAQVYRCGNSYSSAPCADGKTVEVEPGVVAHPSTPDSAASGTPAPGAPRKRRRHADNNEAREWERTERELDKAQATPPPQRQARPDAAQCAAASQRIKKIDELARRGGSVAQMERLREDRQNARDRQFRAGC